MNTNLKEKFKLHVLILLAFLAITFIYFSPLLKGKRIQQSDMTHATGMAKELQDHYKRTGEESLWTNSMFGGMPAYQIFVPPSVNLLNYTAYILHNSFPPPANYLFLLMAGF